MFDYHIHTHFSTDCEVSVRDMIEGAIAAGITEIAVTDHIDYEYNSTEIQFDFNVAEGLREVGDISAEYADRITVRRGLEIGIQPHVLGRCSALVNTHAFDFVIASVHNVAKQDLYNSEFYDQRTPEEALVTYYDELALMLANYRDYSVVGHFDIVKRYNEAVKALPFETYREVIARPLKEVILAGKGIELNLSGYRQGLGESLPSLEVLKLYRELGGEIVTIGSDSHSPESIGHLFHEGIELLKAAGFENLYRFERMIPFAVPFEAFKAIL
jgi:histidinol-phosphatase (PHP family)